MNFKWKIIVLTLSLFVTFFCWGTTKTIVLYDDKNRPVTNFDFLLTYFVKFKKLQTADRICLENSKCVEVLDLLDTPKDIVKRGFISSAVRVLFSERGIEETIYFRLLNNVPMLHISLFDKKEEKSTLFSMCSFGKEEEFSMVPNYDIIVDLMRNHEMPKNITLNLFGNKFNYTGFLGKGAVSTVLKAVSDRKVVAIKIPNPMRDICIPEISDEIYPEMLELNTQLKEGISVLRKRSVSHVGILKEKMRLPYYVVTEYIENPITFSEFVIEILPKSVKCSFDENNEPIECKINRDIYQILKGLPGFLDSLEQTPTGGDLKPDNLAFGGNQKNKRWMVLDCTNDFSKKIDKFYNASNMIKQMMKKEINDAGLSSSFVLQHVELLFPNSDVEIPRSERLNMFLSKLRIYHPED